MLELPDVSQPIVNALSALFGAWAGAKFALRRYRAEKAFERQLQWHEDIAESLYALASALSLAVRADRRVNRPLALEAWKSANVEVAKIAVLGQNAELYATRSSLRGIRQVISQMQDLVGKMPSIPERSDPNYEQHLTHFGAMIPVVRAAGSAVARDVRSHLGLAPVRSPWQRLLARFRSPGLPPAS